MAVVRSLAVFTACASEAACLLLSAVGSPLMMPACRLDVHAWRQMFGHVCCMPIICPVCLSTPAAWLSDPDGLHAAPAQRRLKGVRQPFRSQARVLTRQVRQLPARGRSRGLQTTEQSWPGVLWGLLRPLPTDAGLSQPARVKLRSR